MFEGEREIFEQTKIRAIRFTCQSKKEIWGLKVSTWKMALILWKDPGKQAVEGFLEDDISSWTESRA